MKFKVGDFIKGKENAEYAITDEKMKKGQILKIEEHFVEIKVLEHLDKNEIGQTYNVTKYNFEECFEILKQFTKSDLKDGDVVTYRNGDIRILKGRELIDEEGRACNNIDYAYSDDLTYKIGNRKFDIIKVERSVQYKTVYERKEEILDEAEKRYLRDVIRPFRREVKEILRREKWSNKNISYIHIKLKNNDAYLPDFKTETMYRNMKADKEYNLEELRTIKE